MIKFLLKKKKNINFNSTIAENVGISMKIVILSQP